MTVLTFTKHHGIGNDFLVTFADDPPAGAQWDEVARRVCHRRRGVGADGLLVAVPGANGVDVGMRLYNADGTTAEMSGNGIRCLVQAWARRHRQERGDVVVDTAAGPRSVGFTSAADEHSMIATVDMGPIITIDPPPAWPSVAAHEGRPVAHLSLGNPHTVVAVEDVRAVDLESIGLQVAEVNLEIIEPGPDPNALTMRVHERGAGITEACGTGACAAAWAAASWGLVPGRSGEITVHMDGGDARVRLDQPGPGRVTLIGPVTFVATVEVEL